MKFTINKTDVLDVLSKIQGITGRKSNLAITENILIKAGDSGLTMIATDLETGFEGVYPAKIESEGIIAIHARKFYEIVRDFPSEEINFYEVENKWIEIGNQNVLYHIVGMNPDDFPEIPLLQEIKYFNVDSLAFKKMIERTVMITGASDDKRAHINGVYIENLHTKDVNLVRMVSTDGSRLSLADMAVGEDIDFLAEKGMIVPKKGLTEVGKFLDSEGVVKIGFKDNKFILKKNAETIIIRMLEGDFPQYEDIIVRGKGYSIKIDRHLFLMMLKRMSILSSDTYKGVIFKFNENMLIINTTNPDIGESKEDLAIDFEGVPIEGAFNPKFFIDALNVIDEDSIYLHITDGEKPCLIEGELDKSFLSVIMPMRI
jgi:DNA polymerase-3 subunit beta